MLLVDCSVHDASVAMLQQAKVQVLTNEGCTKAYADPENYYNGYVPDGTPDITDQNMCASYEVVDRQSCHVSYGVWSRLKSINFML